MPTGANYCKDADRRNFMNDIYNDLKPMYQNIWYECFEPPHLRDGEFEWSPYIDNTHEAILPKSKVLNHQMNLWVSQNSQWFEDDDCHYIFIGESNGALPISWFAANQRFNGKIIGLVFISSVPSCHPNKTRNIPTYISIGKKEFFFGGLHNMWKHALAHNAHIVPHSGPHCSEGQYEFEKIRLLIFGDYMYTKSQERIPRNFWDESRRSSKRRHRSRTR